MSELKKELYQLCEQHLTAGIEEIEKKIADAREAANNDTKSSAGDKYETGREMMQQEIDLNMARLAEVQKQQEVLRRLDPAIVLGTVQPGALVHTSGASYFIAVSAGKLSVNNKAWYAISPSAPVALLLTGKSAGDKIMFNGATITIQKIE